MTIIRFLIFWLCLLASINATAQQLRATLKSSVVRAGVPFEVTFIYDADDAGSFAKPDFYPLELVGGPLQSTSQSVNYKDGKQVKSYNLKMVYTLRAADTGVFTIGPASITNKGMEVFRSAPVTVRVVKNEPVGDVVEYKYMGADVVEFFSEIMQVNSTFVLATGPLYYHVGAAKRDTPIRLLHDVRHLLADKGKVEEMSVYLWDSTMPRLYFGLEDTSGVTARLEQYYSTHNYAVYNSKITTRGMLNFGESLADLQGAGLYYLSFEGLKKKLADAGRDTSKAIIDLSWSFGSDQNRQVFINYARKMGYKVKDKEDKRMKLPSKTVFYMLTLSRRTPVDDSLLSEADQLYTLAKACYGQFAMMEVK